MDTIYFETIKCVDFEGKNLLYHEKRMANTTGINFTLSNFIHPIDDKLYRCKITYNDNEIMDVSYFSYVEKNIFSLKLVEDNTIEYSKKYLNRDAIEKLNTKKGNSDEIIIVKNNLITDTSIANIALYIDNQWITPKNPLLQGTTRERYLDQGLLVSKDITVDMLYNCEKLALLNAMIDFKILDQFEIKQ